jgi:hypothetical protein
MVSGVLIKAVVPRASTDVPVGTARLDIQHCQVSPWPFPEYQDARIRGQ